MLDLMTVLYLQTGPVFTSPTSSHRYSRDIISSQHNHQLVTLHHSQVGFSEFTHCWVHCLILLVKLHFNTKFKCLHWYIYACTFKPNLTIYQKSENIDNL